MNPQRFPHLFWKVPRFTIPGLSQTRIKSRFSVSLLDGRIIFGKKTHVAANPCGSSHFSAQNAASPFGLVSPAGSVGAERSPPGSSTAPLREKSRSARLLGCKRPRLRLTVATNFSRLKGIVLWASILSPKPSGKLPLPSHALHIGGVRYFFARVCNGHLFYPSNPPG